MTDNITLPREVVEKALEAFNQHRFDALTVAKEREYERHAEVLRTALAAEQPKPSEDVEALRRDAERLREALLQAQNAAIDLTKKNERLREALAWIAKRCLMHLEVALDAGACARAALRREDV